VAFFVLSWKSSCFAEVFNVEGFGTFDRFEIGEVIDLDLGKWCRDGFCCFFDRNAKAAGAVLRFGVAAPLLGATANGAILMELV